jgi:hypothetical protein
MSPTKATTNTTMSNAKAKAQLPVQVNKKKACHSKARTKPPDKSKVPQSYAKQRPNFNIEKAPGRGLMKYEFPEAGHQFHDGRKAVRLWTHIMNITRAGKPPPKNDDNKNGSQYTRYQCARACGGQIRVVFTPGKCATGTVKKLEQQCVCAERAVPDAISADYVDKDELMGDLIVFINKTYDTFIVNYKNSYVDGTRSNGSKHPVTFQTKEGRLFHCHIVKTKNSFSCKTIQEMPRDETTTADNVLGETQTDAPGASSDVIPATKDRPQNLRGETDQATERTCPICYEDFKMVDTFTLLCPDEKCRPTVCGDCQETIISSRPLEERFIIPLEGFKLIEPKLIVHLNTRSAFQCPFCKQACMTITAAGGSREIKPQLPFGWIGEQPIFHYQKYLDYTTTYGNFIKRYSAPYELAIRLMCGQQPGLTDVGGLVLTKFIEFCAEKIYHQFPWIENSKEKLPEDLQEQLRQPNCSLEDEYQQGASDQQGASEEDLEYLKHLGIFLI